MNTTADVSMYALSLADAILADLNDSHSALEPMEGAKTAGWLVGHLAVSGDFARRLCNRPPMCPDYWSKRFAPGSQPSLLPSDYPPMRELINTLYKVYRDLAEYYPAIPDNLLSAPNPYAPGRAAFPTAGDFVVYLMTAHLGYHLGQLGGWRAAAGFGRISRPDPLAA